MSWLYTTFASLVALVLTTWGWLRERAKNKLVKAQAERLAKQAIIGAKENAERVNIETKAQAKERMTNLQNLELEKIKNELESNRATIIDILERLGAKRK